MQGPPPPIRFKAGQTSLQNPKLSRRYDTTKGHRPTSTRAKIEPTSSCPLRSARLDGLVMISYASKSMESNIMRFGSHGSMTAGSGAAGAGDAGAAAAAAGAEVLVMVGSLCEIFWHSLPAKITSYRKKHKMPWLVLFASCFLLSSSFSRFGRRRIRPTVHLNHEDPGLYRRLQCPSPGSLEWLWLPGVHCHSFSRDVFSIDIDRHNMHHQDHVVSPYLS